MKKKVKRVGIAVIVLLLIVAAYVAYALLAYHRLPDKLTMEVNRNGSNNYFKNEEKITTGKYYWIMTYNVGFGAYRRDYSFFMDGGKYSWAKDEESVMAAVCGMGEIITSVNPDFVLLQEIDRDGTRSYHVDELELLNQLVKGYYYTYAQNYDSPFLFFPPWQPHGANRSGLVTYSKNSIMSAMRRSLPVSESFSKMLDLDRCYSVTRILMENGKCFCIYNVHLSAYGSDASIRENQLAMLYEDMENDYKSGNYVICGGDYNHNLKQEQSENAPDWAHPFPRENLPDGFGMAIDRAKDSNVAHNSCRDAGEPYKEDSTYTVTLDGFILSDNISINYYANMDWGYEFSDHDPVIMQFRLDE